MSEDQSGIVATKCAGTTTERYVLTGAAFRSRGKRVRFDAQPPPAATPAELVRRPAKVARMLALAHHIQWAIDRGAVPDAATVARALGLTRARMSLLLGLCLLAPDIQEELLGLEANDGAEPMAERALREVVSQGSWEGQRGAWTARGR